MLGMTIHNYVLVRVGLLCEKLWIAVCEVKVRADGLNILCDCSCPGLSSQSLTRYVTKLGTVV